MATKNGLEIFNTPNSSLYDSRLKGGGELPDGFKSTYSKSKVDAKMLDLYYAGKLPKSLHKTYESLRKAEKQEGKAA